MVSTAKSADALWQPHIGRMYFQSACKCTFMRSGAVHTCGGIQDCDTALRELLCLRRVCVYTSMVAGVLRLSLEVVMQEQITQL